MVRQFIEAKDTGQIAFKRLGIDVLICLIDFLCDCVERCAILQSLYQRLHFANRHALHHRHVDNAIWIRCAERSARMGSLPPGGAMLSVAADEQAVQQLLRQNHIELSVAACNAPQQTVLSGDEPAISRAVELMAGSADETSLDELAAVAAEEPPASSLDEGAFEALASAWDGEEALPLRLGN